jgi:hypothetical protein
VVCLILIVAIAIEHRRLSRLKRELQRVSEDVKYLAAAEQKRFMLELNSARQNGFFSGSFVVARKERAAGAGRIANLTT